ncbi:aminotransferase class I/II-fold pyridoxal phosphate-dependent enzyme [Haloimpatiens sp. FM7330]|uniref:aminotransferase class I/II-fold pyridoxal phosphate-dependent enzyme n=1 Tax=Haloimpatiens sp. FM7330 TaxID=3298610 RepID=UPI0036381633
MSRLPLIEGVSSYIKEKNISFCMPGHKYGKGFLQTREGITLSRDLLKYDITEVEGVDNLHNAEGIIKESQELLSEYYKSKKSYFLVNGSTSGNLAMIFSAFNEGDKIIVERNCHRSIFNGIIMRKLKPVYIKNKINDKFNAPLSIDMEHFFQIVKKNSDAKGIIITYPNYYGICTDLRVIVKEAKKYNMKVLVDSAHGAHFGVNKLLPKNAIELGADMVVMSSHKTLPSFTQTAYLHIGNSVDEHKVDFYVSAFLSTSPSYMLMCSMEYARYYLEEKGDAAYTKLIDMLSHYRSMINTLSRFHIIGKEDIQNDDFDIDTTRYVINVEKGYSGHKLLEYLRTKKIQAEMSDSQNVVLIFSPFNTEKELKKLYEALKTCPMDLIEEKYIETRKYDIPIMKIIPCEIMNKKKVSIKIEKAEGKISANSIVPYPPGIPLIMPGEIISGNTIDVIKYNIRNGMTILGLDKERGTIDIVKE